MQWSFPYRGVPRASRAISLCAVLLVITLSSGAQRPATDAPVIGEVFSSDAAVQGSVMLAGGGIQVLSGSSVSAGHGTATLKLKRGGEVRVCAGTTVSLSASASGKELLLGFSGGTIETRYSLPLASDTVLTPDFRVMLAGPGAFHFAIGSDASGGTCVRALEASSASIIIHELMGTGVYQVKPGDDVYFPRGEVTSAQSPAPSACGCPPPQRTQQLAESSPTRQAPPVPEPTATAVLPLAPAAAPAASPAHEAIASGASPETTPMVTFVEPGLPPSTPTAEPPPAIETSPQPMPSVIGQAARPVLEPVTYLAASRPFTGMAVFSPPALVAPKKPVPNVTLPRRAVRLALVTELSAARPMRQNESMAPPLIASTTQQAPSTLPPSPVVVEPVTTLSSAPVAQTTDVTPPSVAASAALPRMLPLQETMPILERVTELAAARPLREESQQTPPQVAASSTALPLSSLPPRPVRTEPVTQLAETRAPEIPSAERPPTIASRTPFPVPHSQVTLPAPPRTDGEVRFTVDAPMVFRAEDLPPASPTVTRADLRTPLPVIPPEIAPPPVPVSAASEEPAPEAAVAKPRKKGFLGRLGGFFARIFGKG